MEKNQPTKKHYYFEVFFLFLGSGMIYMGVFDEMHHWSSLSYNSKGMMSVNTGLKECLYGILMIIGSIVSWYAKIKK